MKKIPIFIDISHRLHFMCGDGGDGGDGGDSGSSGSSSMSGVSLTAALSGEPYTPPSDSPSDSPNDSPSDSPSEPVMPNLNAALSGESSTPEEIANSMGIEVKQGPRGADLSNLSEPMQATFSHIEDVWDEVVPDVTPVITSGRDGHEHNPTSHHHTGNALDLRGNNISDSEAERIAEVLNDRLGDDYTVGFHHEDDDQVGEDELEDHIHIEYVPE